MNRLRELREEKKLFQKDIAKILGMSQTGYNQYEIEKNGIPNDILHMLADFYNTSIDYILYRTKEREPYPKDERYQSKLNSQNNKE